MRIAQVIHNLRRAGAERIVVDLSIALASLGHEVTICTLYARNEYKDVLGPHLGDQVRLISLLDRPSGRFLLDLPVLALKLRQMMRSFRPHVVHSHLRTDSAVCLLAGAWDCVRTVHSSIPIFPYRELPVRAWPVYAFERIQLAGSRTRIVACSQAAFDALRRYPLRGRLCLVVNGVDLSRFPMPSRSVRADLARVMTVGTLSKVKNHAMAIRALRRLRALCPGATLRIVGEGSERAHLEQLAARLGLTGAVKLIGQRSNVESELMAASVFWMTSRFEGLGLAAIEAMASGLPVIATQVQGSTELLADWPECLVPLEDDEALAEATAALLADPARYADVARAQQEAATTRYSLDRMVEQYIEVYASAS